MAHRFLLTALLVLFAPALSAQSAEVVWHATVPEIVSLGVSPDGARLATGIDGIAAGGSSEIRFWDAATGDSLAGITNAGGTGFPAPVMVAFDAEGTSVLAAHSASTCGAGGCSSYGDLRRWEPDGTLLYQIPLNYRTSALAVQGPFVTVGRIIANVGFTNFYVYAVEDSTLVYSEDGPVPYEAVFSPDGSLLLTTHDRPTPHVAVRSVGTWVPDTTLDVDPGFPLRPAFSPDGSLVAFGTVPQYGSSPTGIRLYRTSDWEEIGVFPLRTEDDDAELAAQVAFTADGSHLVALVSGFEGSMRAEWLAVYRVSDGERIYTERTGELHVFNDRGPLDIRRIPGSNSFAYIVDDHVYVASIEPRQPPVGAEGAPAPDRPALSVSPNPVAANATVRFAVEAPQHVRVELFDVLGRRVALLYAGEASAGQEQAVPLEAGGYPAGLYVVRVMGETVRQSEKVVLVGR